MNKIIVIGSIHLDLVSRVTKIPQNGETVMGGDINYFFGGKGANQAVAAARQGAEVYMIGKVGNDSFAKPLKDNLKKNNVNNDYVFEDRNHSSGIALIAVNEGGENSIIVSKGASGTLSFDDVLKAKELFSEGDYVLLQQEIPLDTVEKSIAYVKSFGCKVILDPAPAAKLDLETLKMIDIITPNNTEVSILTGLSSNTDDEALNAANALREYTAGTVILTRGKDGVLCLDEKKPRYFKAHPVKAVDTTAAGDCFNGSLVAALASRHTIDEAICQATKASALSVLKEGAQPSLPTLEEVETFFASFVS